MDYNLTNNTFSKNDDDKVVSEVFVHSRLISGFVFGE